MEFEIGRNLTITICVIACVIGIVMTEMFKNWKKK